MAKAKAAVHLSSPKRDQKGRKGAVPQKNVSCHITPIISCFAWLTSIAFLTHWMANVRHSAPFVVLRPAPVLQLKRNANGHLIGCVSGQGSDGTIFSC